MLARDPRTGRFCCGDRPTIADICLVAHLTSAKMLCDRDAAPYPRLRCGHPSSECPQKCEVSAPADYWPSRALIAASVQGFLLHDDWDEGW